MARTTAPYGSWKSPITADRMLAGAVGLGSIAPLGDDLLWTESRPAEGGRIALVRLRSATAARSDRDALRPPTATAEDLLAAPWSVRSRVHEYGGGALTVGDESRTVSEQISGAGRRGVGLSGPVAGGGGGILTEPVLVVNQKAKIIELNNEYSVFDQHGNRIASVRQIGQSAAKKALRLVSPIRPVPKRSQ